MNKINSAIITPVLAAGSVASPYFWQVGILQRLCHKSCVDSQPSFTPTFSVKSISMVSTGQYVATIHVEGLISYIPCDGNECCTKTQLISQDFTLPFASAAAPTAVTITAGVAVNIIAGGACQRCSRNFVSDTPITLTVA